MLAALHSAAANQDIAYDTTRIRAEWGYKERISYEEGLKRTLGATHA